MTNTYITRQGETVDIACWKHYGQTAVVTEAVLVANVGLADLGAILPMGTLIHMPVIETRTAARRLVGLWE